MIPYCFLILVPIAIQYRKIEKIGYQKRNRIALGYFFFVLTILLMLRHQTVGIDVMNYHYMFTDFAATDWKVLLTETTEPGFAYYNKLISLITDDFQVFLAITAVITVLLIYPTYNRLCQDASMTIVLFCIMSTFVMLFSGIRQMLAIALGVRAYEMVRRKKRVWFLLIALFAMTIHNSAFMLLLLYPVYHFKVTKKKMYIVIPMMCLTFLFNQQIFMILQKILERYTRFDIEISSTGAYTMLIMFGVLAVFSYLIPADDKLDLETKGLRNILLLVVVIQMFAPLHMLAMRMNYYFIIFIPLLIPKIIVERSKRYEKVAVVARHLMVIGFLIYFFIILGPSKSLNVFPYHFFWERI